MFPHPVDFRIGIVRKPRRIELYCPFLDRRVLLADLGIDRRLPDCVALPGQVNRLFFQPPHWEYLIRYWLARNAHPQTVKAWQIYNPISDSPPHLCRSQWWVQKDRVYQNHRQCKEKPDCFWWDGYPVRKTALPQPQQRPAPTGRCNGGPGGSHRGDGKGRYPLATPGSNGPLFCDFPG